MRFFSLIFFVLFTDLFLSNANAQSMDDITVILWRKQTNMMKNEDKLAVRLEQLMDVVGRETATYKPEQLEALQPGKFEDRIRLIALARFQHPERFEEILKNYVLRPSQEEFEKMRVVLLQTYAGQVPDEEWKKMKEQVEKLNSEHAPPPLNLRPPGEIKSKHLEGQYAFCFEYYWMSPNRENCYLHYEETLAKALNQFKERTRGVDMRDLIEKKMKTFDPRKAPNFKLLED